MDDMSQERREEIRRAIDVDNLITRKEFDTILTEVRENTALTKQVHDILAGLKIMAHIAKWVTVIVACFTALVVAVKTLGAKP